MLPSLIIAPMGCEYQLVDPAAKSGNSYQYLLIEQEATGNTNEYGPFEVDLK